MQEDEGYIFDQCQIGRGFWPLAQHGYVVVKQGTLTLLGSNQQEIATAPLSEVAAHKTRMTRGQTLSLSVGGRKYFVSPGWGRVVGAPVLPGDARPIKNAAEELLGLIERG